MQSFLAEQNQRSSRIILHTDLQLHSDHQPLESTVVDVQKSPLDDVVHHAASASYPPMPSEDAMPPPKPPRRGTYDPSFHSPLKPRSFNPQTSSSFHSSSSAVPFFKIPPPPTVSYPDGSDVSQADRNHHVPPSLPCVTPSLQYVAPGVPHSCATYTPPTPHASRLL